MLLYQPHAGEFALSLSQTLDTRVREAELIQKLDDGAVRCFACGHRCLVKPGRRGICKVRFNKEGTLFTPAGYVAALQCDPTEKKPFFHCLPGSDTLTFGMLAAIFIAGIARTGSPRRRYGTMRRRDATDVTPDALVALARGKARAWWGRRTTSR